ncbi:MAG: hypothetical protein J3Q66DRAFT_351721 [Benniella sp.]|nr:MAG: hypothetical protein J3Q66DRAFT_351721 [Benniella sp.]
MSAPPICFTSAAAVAAMYPKADFKAQKKCVKLQAKVSKREASAIAKEAKHQAKELKNEVKHQTKQLRDEIKHQAKAFDKEARHQSKEALKTLKRSLENNSYYNSHAASSSVGPQVHCSGTRYDRRACRSQRKQEHKQERHARRHARHHSSPLHCVIRTVIKTSLRLLAGEPQRADRTDQNQRVTIVRPEPLAVGPAPVTQATPFRVPSPICSTAAMSQPLKPLGPPEPLLVYAMSNMTLRGQAPEGLSSQASSSSSSQPITPRAMPTPRPVNVREDEDNADFDAPPPSYQDSIAHHQ